MDGVPSVFLFDGQRSSITTPRASPPPATLGYNWPPLKRHFPPRLTNLPGQCLQCQANGSNVCRVLRPPSVNVIVILVRGALACCRANSYPWSPFPLRRVHPGPGPHIPASFHRHRSWSLLEPRQGYLAHKKQPPRRTLLGLCLGPYGGASGRFLLNEVPLYWMQAQCVATLGSFAAYELTSLCPSNDSPSKRIADSVHQNELFRPSKRIADGTPSINRPQAQCVATLGSFAAYELTSADMTVSSFEDLSTINIRRMFAAVGEVNSQPTGPNPLYHCDDYVDRPRARGV